jgi:hypothetical protein
MHPTQLMHLGKVFAYRTTLVSVHPATNARHTGIQNSNAGGQSTVYPDAVRQGTLRPDKECHGICVPDNQCQSIFLSDVARSSRRSCAIWTQLCLPVAAMSSGRSRGYWTPPWLLNAGGLLNAVRGFVGCRCTLHVGDIAVTVVA